MELPSGFIFTLKVKSLTEIEVYERELITCKHCIHCADDWNGDQPMFTCELGRCGEDVMICFLCKYYESSGMTTGEAWNRCGITGAEYFRTEDKSCPYVDENGNDNGNFEREMQAYAEQQEIYDMNGDPTRDFEGNPW